MKQLVLSLMLALATVFVFPLETFAQNTPDDDGEEVVIVIDESSQGNGHGRSIIPAPFSVTLFRSLNCIQVEFLDNMGEITISLTNFITGSISSLIVDSQVGSVVVPFAPSSGLWQISFHLEGSGTSYSGTFII